MTQLYNVSFTTRTLIRKFDAKGREIGVSQMDKPVTLSALPYSTAMSYQIADNFKIERYVPEQRRSKFGSGRDSKVGNGTKMRGAGVSTGEVSAPKASANVGRSRVAEAAASGNLGAALNV